MKYQDLDKNPAYQLWLATNSWQRIVRKTLEPLHLTYVQFVLLATIAHLSHEDAEVTQAQVSRFADTDENMTSQVIRLLAEHGLVERTEHPTDARARCLTLTEQGAALVQEAKDRLIPARDRFFSPLGERVAELADLLRQVVASDSEA